MEYTELADYPVPTGKLSSWHFTADENQWAEDERSLSINHEDHLRDILREEKNQAHHDLRHVSEDWIGGAFVIHQPLDTEAFREALTTWFGRHETYRTTATAHEDNDGTTTFTRYTMGPSAVHVRRNDIGIYTNDQLVRHEIHRYFAHEVNGIGWPHIAVTTIEPVTLSITGQPADEFTVIFAADHSVMDAYTQLLTIAEVTELYSAAREKRESNLPPAGSYIDFCAGERAVTETESSRDNAVEQWKNFFGRTDGQPMPPVFPLPVHPHTTTPQPMQQQRSLSTWLLGEEDVSLLGARAKDNGGSTKSALLTALKLALTELAPVESARYIMPMHTRYEPKYMLSAGWFVGLTPVDDPLNGATSFTEAFEDTVAATKLHRDLSVYPYAAVCDELGITEPPRFVVSYVDTRFIPGADAWTERERVLRSSVMSDDDVYIWLNRANGGLNVSMRYPNNPQAEESVSAFLSRFTTILTKVIETGDYTATVLVTA